MPSGRIHAMVGIPVALTLTATGVGASLMLHPVLAGVTVGAWLGVIVTPDIDHHYITVEEQRIARWNKIAGLLWWLYWWPYERTHPHRGKSHSWPAGTVGRMVYLCWPLLVASMAIAEGDAGVWLLLFWVLVFVGWSVQDCIHLAMDGK